MSEVRRGRPPKAKIPTEVPKTPIVTGGPIPKSAPVRPTPVAEAKETPVATPAETVTPKAGVKAEPVTEVKAETKVEVKADILAETPVETPVEVKEEPKAEPTVDDVKAELSEFLGKVRLLSSRNKDEMPAVCRISRSGRYYYLTIPQLPNSAITDCWAIAHGRMTGEECVAYIVSVLGISPPRLYSKYESIELD